MLLVAPSTWWPAHGQWRLRWDHDEVITTHRTDICTGTALHELLALPDGGSVTFWNRACCLLAGRKSCRPTDSPFLFPVCVSLSLSECHHSSIICLFLLLSVSSSSSDGSCLQLTCFSPRSMILYLNFSVQLTRCFPFSVQNKQQLFQTVLHY